MGEIHRAVNKQLMWEGVETQDRQAKGWTGPGEATASVNAGPFSEDADRTLC